MSEICPGLCFYYQNPESPVPHLWVVLTQAEGNPSKVICVNLSSVKLLAQDQTVILNVGDHRDIKVPSFAYYRKASAFRVEAIMLHISEDPTRRTADCSPHMLTKLRIGLLKSDQTREKIFDYCMTLESFQRLL